MPNLTRLVLSKDAEINAAGFLGSIPKIEHLQVRFSDSAARNVDFGLCKQLKTLVYFGTPPKSVVSALATLPKLESVVVVDLDDGTLDKPAAVKNLKAAIPGMEIQIVPLADFRSKPTEKFLRHAREQAEKARKRLFDPDAAESQ